MTQGVRFKPTADQLRTARAMAGYGMPHVDIASFFDIDAKTLRKYFGRELELGSIEATAKVAQSLFRMATEGKNVAAAIFWMKARAGWREKQIEPPVDDRDAESMTDAELEEIARSGRPRAGPQSLTITRIIIDPKAPAPMVIDGEVNPTSTA